MGSEFSVAVTTEKLCTVYECLLTRNPEGGTVVKATLESVGLSPILSLMSRLSGYGIVRSKAILGLVTIS